MQSNLIRMPCTWNHCQSVSGSWAVIIQRFPIQLFSEVLYLLTMLDLTVVLNCGYMLCIFANLPKCQLSKTSLDLHR